MAKLRKLVKALEAEGWVITEQRGPLARYLSPAGDRCLTLPLGKAALPPPVAAGLAAYAGLRGKID